MYLLEHAGLLTDCITYRDSTSLLVDTFYGIIGLYIDQVCGANFLFLAGILYFIVFFANYFCELVVFKNMVDTQKLCLTGISACDSQGCQHCVSKKSGNFAKCLTGHGPARAQEVPAEKGRSSRFCLCSQKFICKNRVKILEFKGTFRLFCDGM